MPPRSSLHGALAASVEFGPGPRSTFVSCNRVNSAVPLACAASVGYARLMMRLVGGVGLVALLVTGPSACSGSTNGGAFSSDAGDSDGGVTNAKDGGPSSQTSSGADAATKGDAGTATLLACGQSVTSAAVQVTVNPGGTPLDAKGGTLGAGHYSLRQAFVISANVQPAVAADLWLEGDRYELQTKIGTSRKSYGGTVEASGTSLTMTVDCGGEDAMPAWDFTAAGITLLTSFTDADGLTWNYVWKRVP